MRVWDWQVENFRLSWQLFYYITALFSCFFFCCKPSALVCIIPQHPINQYMGSEGYWATWWEVNVASGSAPVLPAFPKTSEKLFHFSTMLENFHLARSTEDWKSDMSDYREHWRGDYCNLWGAIRLDGKVPSKCWDPILGNAIFPMN